MAKIKYDAVVQAVHYKPNGEVDWVRTFQRRGPIFTDYVIVDRESLIREIKAGKLYLTGIRLEQLGGTFEVGEPLRVAQSNGKDYLVVGDTQNERDNLKGVPIV